VLAGGDGGPTDGGPTDGGPGDGPHAEGPHADGVKTDGPPKPDAPKPDAPKTDAKPKPDTKPWPDTSSSYVDESFATGAGKVTLKTGTWTHHSTDGGYIKQNNHNGNGYYAGVSVPVSDYVAETRLRIHSIDGLSSIIEGAALSVRVQPQSNTSYPPGQYACFVSPDAKILGIAECSGGTTYCTMHTTKSVNIQLNTTYTLRATVSGSTVTCRLVGTSHQVTRSDSTYSGGGVALSTFHASASFYYLKVW
jgi:hypothetical protein